jgi:hypothetical protein
MGGVSTGDNDNLVMVVEGTAPFTQAFAGTQGRSVSVIEVTLSKSTSTAAAPCATRAGQTGGGPEGANAAGCVAVTGAGIAAGLPGGGTVTAKANVQ